MKKFILGFAFFNVMLIFSTSLLAAENLSIQIESSALANIDHRQPMPLPISVFLLRDDARFNKANYFSLEDSSHRTLGESYITKRSTIMLPNQVKQLTLPENSDAKYIGFVGGYTALKGKRWRRVIRLSDIKAKNVIARFNNTGIVFRYTEKILPARQNFYAEGTLSYSFMSAASNIFYYSQQNLATLEINKKASYGQLGMGIGYEWERGHDNWLNTLHLEKISVGLGFYYTPVINISGQRISGQRISNLNKSGVQDKKDYKITANSQAVMLEGKINFLRMGSFTTFVNGGVGTVQYQNRYDRDSSSGMVLTTNHSNSSMAYKAGFGLEYDYNEQLSMSLGYEYQPSTKLEIDDITSSGANSESSPTITINNSTLAFKLRYLF
jgi:type VI secretion system VasD/TssJ family lipoprotein